MCMISKTRPGFTPTDHLSKKTESSVVQEHALGLSRYLLQAFGNEHRFRQRAKLGVREDQLDAFVVPCTKQALPPPPGRRVREMVGRLPEQRANLMDDLLVVAALEDEVCAPPQALPHAGCHHHLPSYKLTRYKRHRPHISSSSVCTSIQNLRCSILRR